MKTGSGSIYTPLRMADVPYMNIAIVDSTEAPVGLEEPPATVVAPAIDNAIYAFFSLVKIITKAAPAGAFGAISFTVGKCGIASLIPIFKLILTFYVTAFIFIAVVLGTVARMAGFNVFRLLAYLKGIGNAEWLTICR